MFPSTYFLFDYLHPSQQIYSDAFLNLIWVLDEWGREERGHEGVLIPCLQGEQFYPCSTEASYHGWQPMRLPTLIVGISGLRSI